MNKDLTKGTPWKLILSFFIPAWIGNLFQQFYNMADTIIVGKLLGVGALAAVGATGSLLFLVFGFVIGLCNGFGIPIAQFYGAKDMKSVRKCVVNIFFLMVVLSVIVTAASLLSIDWLLTIMQTPEDIYGQARAYLLIMFWGIGVTMFYNVLACIARALGDVRTPLYFLILASVLNIVLDIVCINNFKMGVAGAAYATVAAQLVGAVACLFYMWKKYPELQVKREDMRLDGWIIRRLLHAGIPMALQFSITAIGAIVIQVAVNSFGSGIVAAVTAAQKIQMFLTQALDTIGMTMATYCGQNLGAGKLDRVKTGVIQSCIGVIGYGLLALGIIYLFGEGLAMLFIKKEEAEIMPYIIQFMRTNAVFFWALGLLLVLRNSIQGLGFTNSAMLAGVVEMIARVFVAVYLVKRFAYQALCYSNPAAWVMATILLVVLFIYLWKRKLAPQTAGSTA